MWFLWGEDFRRDNLDRFDKYTGLVILWFSWDKDFKRDNLDRFEKYRFETKSDNKVRFESELELDGAFLLETFIGV